MALLLHTLGVEGLRDYNSFGLDNLSVADIMERFEEFALGELNQIYEVYI